MIPKIEKELARNEAESSAEKNLRTEGVSLPTGKVLEWDLIMHCMKEALSLETAIDGSFTSAQRRVVDATVLPAMEREEMIAEKISSIVQIKNL